MSQSLFRNLLFILAMTLLLFLVISKYTKSQQVKNLTFSEVEALAKSGQVASVTIKGQRVSGVLKAKDAEGIDHFAALLPPDLLNWSSQLAGYGVKVEAETANDREIFSLILVGLLVVPMIVLGIYFTRQISAGGNRALSFGKSRARIAGSKAKVTFKDVAGIDEVKEELQEIIEFLKDPKRFQKLGGRIPRGVLLMGSPGSGKTLLAKAVAGEAGVPFYSISGSEFVEMFVGVGASRVRDLFEQGKKNAPCIIYIDEIDAVGRHRGAGLGGGHDEREQTLNQLLVEMDGFETNDTVIVMAATNRPDVLDPALLRPGRFDRRIVVPRPDQRGREEILRVHTAKVPLESGADLGLISRGTPGFSGADLANLVNEAALLAARLGQKTVRQGDFEAAKDKVLMGPERRSLLMSDAEKKTTAYHETGHALVGYFTPASDPLHKVTIIPRGRALGATWRLPETDRYNESRESLEAHITVAMGGRAAEELFLGQRTTGAANDLKQATEIARAMVTEYGMSDRLGPLHYGGEEQEIFLGRDYGRTVTHSEQTAQAIDEETRRIITDADARARAILREHGPLVHKVAAALLERETLDREELTALVENRPLAARPAAGAGEPPAAEEKPADAPVALAPKPSPA